MSREVITSQPRAGVTTIKVRLLEIMDDDRWIIKMDEHHKDGYYEFLIEEKVLNELLSSDNQKESLYDYLARSYNRAFMEFLMLELCIDSCYLASIQIDDRELEFSYLEIEYMDDARLNDSVQIIYGEEFGMMSDFDYYPYGYAKGE